MTIATTVATMKVADTVATLLLAALAAAQKYAQIQANAAAEGRAINIDDLKAARVENDTAAEELDSAIAKHQAMITIEGKVAT